MDYDRKAKLRESKFVMDKELQDSKTEVDLAKNSMDIDSSRLQTIRERLQKSVIRAPHEGIVLNLRAREGVVVTGANTSGEATLLMQIADLAQVEVNCEIGEVDVIKISIGMPASLTFDALPGMTQNGVVRFVSPSALPKALDRTVRVFPMIIAVESPDAQLKPGITANVVISTGKNPHALGISVGAIFTENGQPCVFVKKGNGYERRVVNLGLNDTAFVEVKSGLREGDEVALQHPPDDTISPG
jgi:RND family efflux transporter MFP subunit